MENRKGLKIIITGDKEFDDYQLFKKEVLRVIGERAKQLGYDKIPKELITIISGAANNTDKMAKKFADEFNIEIERFIADRVKHGNNAGKIRNQEMIIASFKEMNNNDRILIAFWDEKTLNTKCMIDVAKDTLIDTYVIRY